MSAPAAGAAPAWRLAGEYLEACNCEVLCPCLLGPRDAQGGATARPTEGHCDVPVVFAIESGRHGDVPLDGLHGALAIYTPGPMAAGGWTLGVYVDGRGSDVQRQALDAILSGRAGGAPARLAPLVVKRLPTRAAPIVFAREGRRRSARIEGVLDVEVEGIEGADGSETWLDNVRHFVSRRLAAARSRRMSFTDHGLAWSHAGRNAHYARFEWRGP